jgi:methyltransferase-like protein/SAM-dependent methyltransferase
MTSAPTSYDEVPYTSYAYPLTHPDRLATVGRLFGMTPAPIERARVLELGCASGGNLIPLAEQLPGAEIVGVDLSAVEVGQGQAAIRELGISNVTLHHADLQAIDASWGRFDYVLCHGVFSWVARPVQDRILAICRENLAPQGIAYVSYNTYPGWHLRESVRHMMRFHTGQFADPHERTAQAGALVDFLLSAAEDQSDLPAQLLRREVDILAGTSPEYLFHEHLEEHNEPCYFHQFAERLPAQRLQYLGEADVYSMFTRELAPAVGETLARISKNLIALEQYLDFVRYRQFRQTLLCHAVLALERNIGPELIPGFQIACTIGVPEDLDLAPDVVQPFIASNELTIRSAQPVTKAAFALLGERWPDSFAFEELCEAVHHRLAAARIEVPTAAFTREQLAVDLLACIVRGGVELRTHRIPEHRVVGERPRVSAYARWQAAHGAFVTNRRHTRVDFEAPMREVLRLLDGTRDRTALVDALVERVAAGSLALASDDERITEPEAVRAALSVLVDHTLSELAARSLLAE